MKKKIGLLALCAMMLFMVTACGGKPQSANSNGTGQQNEPSSEAAAIEELEPEPGAELIWWTLTNDQKPFADYAVKEFEKKYNIKVTVENVAYWDSIGRLSVDGPAGAGADVFGLQNEAVVSAVKSGLVLPNDYFEEETKEINPQEAIDAASYDGILYGYPWNVYTISLYYNKDLVKDAKLETWEDIIAFSKEFNDEQKNQYGIMFPLEFFWVSGFLTGYGGYIFGDKETDPADIGLNNEGAVKAYEFMQSLRDVLPLKKSDASVDVKNGLWEQGKLAINVDGSWAIGNYNKLPFEAGVLPMPALPGGDIAKPLADQTSYYISSYSKYPNAARLFAHFITTREMQIKINELTGAIPAAEGIESDERIRKDELTAGFFKQIKNTHRWPHLNEFDYVWGPMDAALETIWNGGDVKTNLDKAVKAIKTAIENQK